MSRKFKVPLGLVPLTENPASGSNGDTYFNDTDKAVYVYDGTNWTPVGGGSIDGGSPTSVYLVSESINGGTP